MPYYQSPGTVSLWILDIDGDLAVIDVRDRVGLESPWPSPSSSPQDRLIAAVTTRQDRLAVMLRKPIRLRAGSRLDATRVLPPLSGHPLSRRHP